MTKVFKYFLESSFFYYNNDFYANAHYYSQQMFFFGPYGPIVVKDLWFWLHISVRKNKEDGFSSKIISDPFDLHYCGNLISIK